jgi:hypothetical protein
MNSERAAQLISASLGSRRFIWVGYHGVDAASLTVLPQFSHCYSLGVPLGDPGVEDFSVERRFSRRKVNRTSWDDQLAYRAMTETLLPACEVPSVIAAFAPTPFFEGIERERPAARYIGITWEQFRVFDSKAHVEAQLRQFAGDELRFVDWRPLPNDSSRADLVRAELAEHPVVLRTSFFHSGIGHELIRDEAALAMSRLIGDESACIGPFLEDHIPLALGACVFPDGEVTLHCPSVQLIGLTSKSPFGYCGNDFAAIKQLDRRLLEDLEAYAKVVGRWLHSQGYVGAFGIDTMIYDGQLLYTELNPRFQGSTWLQNRMDAELGVADIVQDHLMAWLGIDSHPSPPLSELVRAQPERAQVLVSNMHEERVQVAAEQLDLPDGVYAELVPAQDVLVYPDNIMFALVFDRGVTTHARSIDAEATAVVDAARQSAQLRGRPLRPG